MIVLPNVVCFSKFAFRLLKISIVEKKLIDRPVPKIRPKHPIKRTPSILSGLEHPHLSTNIGILKPPGCSSFQ